VVWVSKRREEVVAAMARECPFLYPEMNTHDVMSNLFPAVEPVAHHRKPSDKL
jgi:hypothetical protein